MITLYGSPRTSAGRCIWALEEAGIPYTLKDVDMRNKEHKSEAYLKINPMGKVPAMTDGEVTLFESMAINYYIAQKYKKELLGTNDLEKGLAMQWSFWATSELQPPIIEVFIQKVFMPDDKRDQNIIENNLKKLPNLLSVLNHSLKERKYLAGSQFTIGDINAASVVSICPMIGIDFAEYPHIKNWLSSMNERAAFQKYQSLRK
ncbi:MAG: glutathione S-transferase family protein [Bacteriovoracaceae bacterium]|nr:glutathione S-transferase family protein [Bacteriovoracaceae bacterium]